jgi:hypothetical protein
MVTQNIYVGSIYWKYVLLVNQLETIENSTESSSITVVYNVARRKNVNRSSISLKLQRETESQQVGQTSWYAGPGQIKV